MSIPRRLTVARSRQKAGPTVLAAAGAASLSPIFPGRGIFRDHEIVGKWSKVQVTTLGWPRVLEHPQPTAKSIERVFREHDFGALHRLSTGCAVGTSPSKCALRTAPPIPVAWFDSEDRVRRALLAIMTRESEIPSHGQARRHFEKESEHTAESVGTIRAPWLMTAATIPLT